MVRGTVPRGSEGRWSLRTTRFLDAPSATERSAALARTLLERYGVLTREAVAAEGTSGGFSSVYEVLKAMEDGGRVRRGYFLAERGATQFALPGADDRLRALRPPSDAPRTLVLAATDPANPYGSSLPWPVRPGASAAEEPEGAESGGPRPQRAAGATVILRDGVLLGWLARGFETLLTFLPEDEAQRVRGETALAEALAGLSGAPGRRALLLSTIDGAPADKSPLGKALQSAGFVITRDGWIRRAGAAFPREGGAHA
jgi:ATP-dependent Lhr-like helicase